MSSVEENVDYIKSEALSFLNEGKGILGEIDEIGKWDTITEVLQNISKISNFVVKLIIAVELASKKIEGGSSEEKLAAACQTLDEMIKFPWYLEALDGPLFKILISALVVTINRIRGNDWDTTLMQKSLQEGKDFLGMGAGHILEVGKDEAAAAS